MGREQVHKIDEFPYSVIYDYRKFSNKGAGRVSKEMAE